MQNQGECIDISDWDKAVAIAKDHIEAPKQTRSKDKHEDKSPESQASEEASNNLAEFKRLWKRCTKQGKAAIRIWIDENYLSDTL